jgi:23S rRNA (adenine2503-C2)-methyltransferase
MKVRASTGNPQISTVFIAEFDDGKCVEMVEAVQPPIPKHKKWVLIVSTLFGCPVRCPMCDAGGDYQGKLSKEEIIDQIAFLVTRSFPDGNVPVEKFKIQFARMGEPVLNPCVLDVLDELPARFNAPGLVPSVSTIAPAGTDGVFERLLKIKNAKYGNGKFQLQFSIHTTDAALRDWLIPVPKWSFAEIADYGEEFCQTTDRKIALNFALAQSAPLEAEVLLRYFNPDKFLIKITPLNPTYAATLNKLTSYVNPSQHENSYGVIDYLRSVGYEVILSIGELEENNIGSNCGQYLLRHLRESQPLDRGYSYPSKAVE